MELFFRSYGEGPPVIILHGLFGMSDNWATFSKSLAAKGFSVYTPDLRNHGNSPHSAKFSYRSLSGDLYEFIQEHNILHPVLIGHSMGGKIVMNFALSYPGIAEQLIIIDMGIRAYKIHNDDVLKAMAITDLSKMVSRKEIEEALSKIIPSARVIQLLMKNVKFTEDQGFLWKLNIHSLLNNFHEIFSAIPIQNRSEIPALFIAADNPDYLITSDLPSLKKIFPNAEITSIPETSHWIHADKPNELLSIILNFIEKNSKQV